MPWECHDCKERETRCCSEKSVSVVAKGNGAVWGCAHCSSCSPVQNLKEDETKWRSERCEDLANFRPSRLACGKCRMSQPGVCGSGRKL